MEMLSKNGSACTKSSGNGAEMQRRPEMAAPSKNGSAVQKWQRLHKVTGKWRRKPFRH
jgi:hypothetical protein